LPIERGDRFELVLGEFGTAGEVDARYCEVPVTVSGGLPGERVVVELVRKYPDHIACRVVDVLVPMGDRVLAPCPYFGPCTGCQYQHISYDRQLILKRDRVVRAFDQCAGPAGIDVRPTVPSRDEVGYRNHARFTVGREGEVGFVNRHTRRFLRVDECLLMTSAINRTLGQIQSRLRGMTQLSVRAGINTGELLIQPKLVDGSLALESGGAYYHDSIRGMRFRVAGSSFFQVNVPMAERVVDTVAEALGLSGGEVVVDAYAGVGVLATLLAGRAREVIGIEDSASAVEDARANASGLENVRFVMGRTEVVLPTLTGVDAVVMDPPRKGCHPDALTALRALAPTNVAMVSCEPEALARDLAVLCAGGTYRVDWVQPIDMFPQTYHVECVAAVRRAG
jgi:23S rRNA (uracil1939-C5)-methyltransferase